jgi:predicted nucleic acid-binding protein
MGAAALWVTPELSALAITAPISRDPDDDKFIHLALAGKAAWLITGDQDLLTLTLENLEIMTPAQVLEKIQA